MAINDDIATDSLTMYVVNLSTVAGASNVQTMHKLVETYYFYFNQNNILNTNKIGVVSENFEILIVFFSGFKFFIPQCHIIERK